MAWWDSSQHTSQPRLAQNAWDVYGDEIWRFSLFPPLPSRRAYDKDRDRDWERHLPYVVIKTSWSPLLMAGNKILDFKYQIALFAFIWQFAEENRQEILYLLILFKCWMYLGSADIALCISRWRKVLSFYKVTFLPLRGINGQITRRTSA